MCGLRNLWPVAATACVQVVAQQRSNSGRTMGKSLILQLLMDMFRSRTLEPELLKNSCQAQRAFIPSFGWVRWRATTPIFGARLARMGSTADWVRNLSQCTLNFTN
jgi:hypothetical protein